MAEGTDRWGAIAGRAAHPARSRTGPSADVGDVGRDLDWLWAVASGLASVTSPWDAEGDPGRRAQETLIWNEAYEVVLQRWPVGHGGDLHDHGLSQGAVCVVSGELDETVVEGRSTSSRRHGEGEGSVFRAGTLHRLANVGPTPAVTVHVFAPPLHEVTSYGRTDDGGLTVLGTHPVGPTGDGDGAPEGGAPA